LLALRAPRLHGKLVHAGLLQKSRFYDELAPYLFWFEGQMSELNARTADPERSGAGIADGIQLVPPEGIAPPGRRSLRSLPGSDYTPLIDQDEFARQVRQEMRVLDEIARGGEAVNAGIAAVHPNSRIVRDVVRVLDSARDPIVLLGEPGGGKSTVLREIAARVARRGLDSADPVLPVYVALGAYRAVDPEGSPGDVLALILQSIPRRYAEARSVLLDLLEDGRLAVFFDGMDEMDRSLYTGRIQKLSDFASRHRTRVKTLFACRTANFSPAFEHRQVVLRRFSPDKIREYMRKNFLPQTELDGQLYSRRQIARRLFASPSFRDTARIPLTLFLLMYYIRKERAWPESRHQLYGTYVRFLHDRLAHYWAGLAVSEPCPARDVVIRGWQALAYQLMVKNEGTCLSRAEFAAMAFVLGQPQLAEWAERSGLLRPEWAESAGSREEGGVLRFSHHQIQEYLAGMWLVAHDGEQALDWARLIDSPRWQETLAHAASINPATLSALTVLEDTFREIAAAYAEVDSKKESLKEARDQLKRHLDAIEPDSYLSSGHGPPVPVYGPEKIQQRERLAAEIAARERELAKFHIPPGRESVWAERVLLASQIFKEAGGGGNSLRDPIPALYCAAVRRLANQGRPPSQVKMLWAFRNAPDICSKSDLEIPFHSPTGWVRDQAIDVVASLVGRTDADLDREVLFDFGRGQLFSHLPAYFRAAAGRAGWFPKLLWGVVCNFVWSAGLVSLSFGILLAAMAVADPSVEPLWVRRVFPGLGHPWHPAVGLFAASVLAVFASGVVPGWPLILRLPVIAATLGCLILGFRGLHTPAGVTLSYALRVGVPAALAVLFGLAVRLWMLVLACGYCVPGRILRERRGLGNFLRDALQFREVGHEQLILYSGLFGLAVSVVVALVEYGIAPVVRRLSTIAWLTGIVNVGIVLLMAGLLAFVLGMMLSESWGPYRQFWKGHAARFGRFRATALHAAVVLSAALVVVAIGYAISAFAWVGRAGEFFVNALVGAILTAAGAFVVYFVFKGVRWWTHSAIGILRFRLLWLMTGRFRLTLPEHMESRVWQAQFVVSSAFEQAAMLTQTTERTLDLTVRGFLTLLEDCEIDVGQDPASTIYWRRRHDLEQILKQQNSGRIQPND
jgi:hypothetical protein